LFEWAKEDNPLLYEEMFAHEWKTLIKQKYMPILEKGLVPSSSDIDMAELFLKCMEGRILYKRGEEKKEGTYYLYNDDEWFIVPVNLSPVKNIMKDIAKIFASVCIEACADLQKRYLADEDKKDTIKNFQKEINRVWDSLKSDKKLNSIASSVKTLLAFKPTDIVFDVNDAQLMNIHFKNGVYELDKKVFRKRRQTDYVLHTLDWNYIPKENIEQEAVVYVDKFFRRLQPDDIQRAFTLSWLYYCITGDTSQQKMKFNVGYGASNGKSTELSIHEKVFDLYTTKFDNKVFEKGNTTRHKQIKVCFEKPIRLAYMEELPIKKLDDEYMKNWVSGGTMNCDMLFGYTERLTIQTKLSANANNDPPFRNDSGVARRGLTQYYRSVFVQKQEEVDETKHTYLLDPHCKDKFNDIMYKNAYLHLLLAHNQWQVPDSANLEFREAIACNDVITPVIQDNYMITKDSKDCISKVSIVSIFNCPENSDKYREVSAYLKQVGCVYKKDIRLRGSRGVWTGIRELTEEERQADEMPQQDDEGNRTDGEYDTVSDV
jgi:hypothetical protein